jgi:probable HAF family extracellular repeat protein
MPSRPTLIAGLAILAGVACDRLPTAAGPRAESLAGPAELRSPPLDYSAVDLGTLGGPVSVANDINERGQVVGSSSTATGEDHPFLWTPAAGMVDLGTLAIGRPATALAINNAGSIVGVAENASGDERAVLWTGAGQIRDLGAPPGFSSRAEDINERGVVVGMARSKTVPFLSHAVRWLPNGRMEDLGTLGTRNARLAGINGGGDVIANTDVGPFFTHVLLLQRNRPPVDIGNLGGTHPLTGALALEVSNRGDVTGFSAPNDDVVRAFLWTKETGMRDLGALHADFGFSQGSGVNARRMVVGLSSVSPIGPVHAFVWMDGAGMRDLGTLGGAESTAMAINESGEIVGSADLPGTPLRSHATLWRPTRRP